MKSQLPFAMEPRQSLSARQSLKGCRKRTPITVTQICDTYAVCYEPRADSTQRHANVPSGANNRVSVWIAFQGAMRLATDLE